MVLSLTNLPSEILYMILTKVYEEPQNLTIHSPSRLNIAIAPNSYLNSLLVNRLIYDEALKALRHHTDNTITLNRHAVLTDLEPYLPSSSLACFLQSIRTFDIPNFPYGSIIIRCWKQSCPKIDTINVSRIYSPTANAAVHSTLMRSSYTSLLRGDVDNTFANAAINCILRTHQNFRLADIPDNLTLRVPNVIDFWSPHYEQEYYHENRVLILALTITKNGAHVSNKYFQNRLRNVKYKPQAAQKELSRFSGVDYDVKYVRTGNIKDLDYDPVGDCFRTPYS